jgi:MFS family permease
MPIYSRITLGLGPDRMGMLLALSGIGSLIGSIGLLSIPHGRRALALKLATGTVVVALIGMSRAPSFGFAVPAIITLTVGLSTCFGISNIVIQERAKNELRGRISAVTGLSFFGILPFSGLLISWLTDLIGMRSILLAGAIGFGISSALLLAGRRQLASAPAAEPAK